MRTFLYSVLGFILFSGFIFRPTPASALELYALGTPDHSLYRINTEALGSPTLIGSILAPLGADLSELMIPTLDQLYTIDRTANSILTIDVRDASIISNLSLDQDVEIQPRGFDVYPGSVDNVIGVFGQGAQGFHVRTISLGSGVTTFAHTFTGAIGLEAMTYGPDGTLYLVGSPTDEVRATHLYVLPPGQLELSLELNLVGEIAGLTGLVPGRPDLDSLAFGSDGFLYGADARGGIDADLFRIDPTTAEAVNLGKTGITGLNGLANLAPIPEPSIAVLLGVATLMFGLVFRRTDRRP